MLGDVSYISSVPLAMILLFIRFMYVPDDFSPKLLAAFGIIMSEDNFGQQRKPSENYWM